MKIFNNFNIFKKDDNVIGLKSFEQEENDNISNPKIYMGDYSSMFKFNLNKTINPSVGQNLYYLS
ncbi:hypothetical protein IJS77_05645 [bacterium]|nr:hypothetical protein [bacterium]